MPHLNTARGAIDTADLGATLMHEHDEQLTTMLVDNPRKIFETQGGY